LELTTKRENFIQDSFEILANRSDLILGGPNEFPK